MIIVNSKLELTINNLYWQFLYINQNTKMFYSNNFNLLKKKTF